MANRRIYTDKYELVLSIVGKKKVTTKNVTHDRVKSISFDPCKERKFLSMVPSEKITINVTGLENPVVYTKLQEKAFFEDYKKELEKFCKDNRVTFYNNLK